MIAARRSVEESAHASVEPVRAASMIRIEWKPILLWGGGIGALLGLWLGLWVTGFIVGWSEGWLWPGIELSDEYTDLVRIPVELSLGWLVRLLGLPQGTTLLSFLLWTTGFGAAVGACVASLGRLTRLDTRMVGLHSFSWSLRATSTPMAVFGCLAMVVVAGTAFAAIDSWTDDGWFGWVALGILALLWFLAWLLGIPIVACSSGISNRSKPPRWWRPTWPGWAPVLIVAGIEALGHVPEGLLGLIDADQIHPRIVGTAMLFLGVWGVVMFVGPLVQCAVLMRLDGSVLYNWRLFFRWSSLGPWIALHGWWTISLLFLVPPLAAVYLWIVKVVPVLATIHESALEEGLPYVYQLFINACNFVGNFWWLLLSAPLAFLFWFGAARFVSLTCKDNVSDISQSCSPAGETSMAVESGVNPRT